MKKIILVGPYPTAKDGISKYDKSFIDEYKNYFKVIHYRTHFLKSKNPLKIIKLIKLVKIHKPVAIHIQYTPTICGPLLPLTLNFLKSKTKLVITAHESIDTYYKYAPKFLLNMYERSIVKNTHLFIVHNISHRKKVLRLIKNSKKILVIPHPIGEKGKRKSKQLIFKKYGLPFNNNKNIIFFGQIRPKKGIHILLDALKKIKKKNYNLFILGEASKENLPYVNKLKAKAKN